MQNKELQPNNAELHEREDEMYQVIQNSLNNIEYDRTQGDKAIFDLSPEHFKTLTTQERGHFLRNVQLLELLNGHGGSLLRESIQHGTSEAALYVQRLYVLREKDELLVDDNLLSETPQILVDALTQDAAGVYERIVFSEIQHTPIQDYEHELAKKIAQVLNIDEPTPKWINIIPKVFNAENVQETTEKIITEIGFIPTQLLDKKKFKSLGAQSVVAVINALKNLESADNKQHAKRAQYERAKLLNYFIISGNANELRKLKDRAPNITLDVNGIFVMLRGFQSHVPYGLLSDALLATLEHPEHNWVDRTMLQEILLRRAEENNDISTLLTQEQQQFDIFLSEYTKDALSFNQVIEEVHARPDIFARRAVREHMVLPDLLIRELSHSEEGIYTLGRIAEYIGREISDEYFSGSLDYHTKSLSKELHESYKIRRVLLNHPFYYNAQKIIRFLFNPHVNMRVNPEDEFMVVRGKYKKSSDGDQHSFIDIAHKGNVSRVLINERKLLRNKHHQAFNMLPTFGRKEYERVEQALQAFHYFSQTCTHVEQLVKEKPKQWIDDIEPYIQSALYFLLANITKYHQEAEAFFSFSGLDKKNPKEKNIQKLLVLFRRAQEEYAHYLYSNIDAVARTEQRFSPEVKKQDIVFDLEYFEKCKKICAPHSYNTELFQEKGELGTRIAVIEYSINELSETIPHHMLESALDVIRLQRDRPFINMIGGSREYGVHTGNQLAHSIVSIGHTYGANIGIPGTQAGIGVTFGKENIQYKVRYSHLPRAHKAHIFAISPGGNTYFPGNEFVKGTPQKEIYAAAPVDQIITPKKAEWERAGIKKMTAQYMHHAAYEGALYNIISINQPRITVVENGGFWSIVDQFQAFKHGFDVMFIKDSGRFGAIGALLTEHIERLQLDGQERLYAQIIELVRNHIPQAQAEEFFAKDFGRSIEPENDDYLVYRLELVDSFLRPIKQHKGRVYITTYSQIEHDLDAYLKFQLKKQRT